MKIFIVYASTGSGHFKAAEAIYNYFKEKDHNLELKLVDILENTHFLFRNIYYYGYIFLVNYASWIWALVFYITYLKPLQPIIKGIHFIINRLNTMKFMEFLIKENPDFIISTHFLCSEISAYAIRKKKITSKLLTVITDFGVHPFWLSTGTDIYIVASDFTKQELVLRDVKENNIRVAGIPTDPKFSVEYKRNILAEKFNIDKDKFTLLIVTGSFGIGPIENIVDLLYKEDIQILVVCARNKKLFTRLKKKNYPNVSVFGFVDNIEELMAVSDIIITKPGGLTISELLIMELVPIFIYPIPGQETINGNILQNYGIGLIIKDVKDIKNIVLDYKANPEKLNRVKENIKRLRKPFCLSQIYDVICQGSVRDTC